MAGVISVRLPDGSPRELAEGTTAAELAQSIGPGLAKAAVVATVDGQAVDLSTPLADGAEVVHRHRRDRCRAARCSGIRRPMSWPRRCSTVARGEIRHRAGRSRTASTTTSSSPAGRASATTIWNGWRRKCGPSCEDQPFVRHEHAAGGAADLRRPALQARDHRSCRGRFR